MDDLAAKIRWWISGEKPHQSTMEELLSPLSSIVGLEQLLENLTAKLGEIMGASMVAVVLYEPITDRFVGKKIKGGENLRKFNFSHADNLIKWLNVNQSVLDIPGSPEVMRYLAEEEREFLEREQISVAAPLIAVNRLTGIIFLGPKASGRYQQQELARLKFLSDQSALAIENAVLYEFQEDRLRKIFHADRLATVGELAAGAAHEIRNPLTSIRSTIQYLAQNLPDEKRQLTAGIIEEVDRIDQVIKGLLSFSRTSELRRAAVEIGEILDQTMLLLESEIRNRSINVVKKYPGSGLNLIGDASQLKQLFLNLLLNSLQAMPHGGELIISARPEGDSKSDGSVSIEITDSGAGIPPELMPKVFDPFFTTKDNGTGLGLSISYGIVGRHGGDIGITSRTDGKATGTTVWVRLPRQVGT